MTLFDVQEHRTSYVAAYNQVSVVKLITFLIVVFSVNGILQYGVPDPQHAQHAISHEIDRLNVDVSRSGFDYRTARSFSNFFIPTSHLHVTVGTQLYSFLQQIGRST